MKLRVNLFCSFWEPCERSIYRGLEFNLGFSFFNTNILRVSLFYNHDYVKYMHFEKILLYCRRPSRVYIKN